MAIARLSVKVGKAGKAGPHADYIAREGEYASRLERGEALEAKEAGNMPAWAADYPGRFWHAADAFERANGTTYRELELALPRELAAAERAALVREFVKQELAERHPYQWAIHRPKAADGQDQPHAHLMFSERRLDGIARDPSQFFRRYNAKAPEKGGAHKRFGEVDGPNRSQAQRAADLRALRGRWGEMVNDHLARAGLDERIDMRSLKAQGKDRAPEKKQLPSAWRDPNQRAVVLEYRQINREQDQAAAEFRALVPGGHVMDLEAQRAKRRDARQHEKREQIAAIMADMEQAKTPSIEQPVPAALVQLPPEGAGLHRRSFGAIPKAPVPQESKGTEAQRCERLALEAIDRGPPGTAERLYALTLGDLQQRVQAEAMAALDAARAERRQWDEAHTAHQKAEPWMIGRGAWETAGADLNRAGRGLTQRETAAEHAARPEVIEAAAKAKLAEQMPRFTERAEADRQSRLDREAKEQKARIETAKREKVEKDLERANASVGKDFAALAIRRESRSFGFGDQSDDWKDTPPQLRKQIDDYLALPKERREKALKSMVADPRARDEIRDLIKERKQTLSNQRSR